MAGSAVAAEADWPELELVEAAAGLADPVGVTHAGDGSGRVFITGKGGVVELYHPARGVTGVFLDIRERVFAERDAGLLGLAFPPGFGGAGGKRHFYVTYTRGRARDDLESVVSRFRLAEGSDERADPGSEEVLLTVDQTMTIHNVWDLKFGPDEYLYIASGDGGPAGDAENWAQSGDTLRGKLLRLDTESVPPPGAAYRVPPDNPFAGDPAVRDEVWALGLRSPWRIAFDRANGDLYIADVGQAAREELNVQAGSSPGGENYGWRLFEGLAAFSSETVAGPGRLVQPVWEYPHRDGDCSINGGAVYRGRLYPRLEGVYLCGDFCSGRIWGVRRDGREGGRWEVRELLDTALRVTAFGEDEAGNVYLVDLGSDRLFRVVDGGPGGLRLPVFRVLREGGGDFQFRFPTVPAQLMQVQSATRLPGGVWDDVGEAFVGDGLERGFVHPASPGERARFFRVVVRGSDP